ncbi:prepilin-type N-terminal cleavage/methylation domain-containing protein [Thermodesulfobacteriota bacterium]
MSPGRARSAGTAARKAPGFSLLEVMCAVAIIAIAFVPLLRAQSLGIRASGASQNITIATLLARSLMTQVHLEGFPELGFAEGDFSEQGYSNFTWDTDIRIPEDLENLLSSFGVGLSTESLIREVELNIYWTEELRWKEGKPKNFTLTAWIINQGAPGAFTLPSSGTGTQDTDGTTESDGTSGTELTPTTGQR